MEDLQEKLKDLPGFPADMVEKIIGEPLKKSSGCSIDVARKSSRMLVSVEVSQR